MGASQTEVIYAYQAAITADGSADASIALARYYVLRQEWGAAQGLLVDNGRPRFMGLNSAVAIIDLASAKIELAGARPDSPDNLMLLRAAEQAARDPNQPNGNVGVNSALGVAYFNVNRNEARRYLELATNGATAASEAEGALQLEAYYYRSVLETQDVVASGGRDFSTAMRFSNNGVQPHALRQACLVRLLQGESAVFPRVREGPSRVYRELPAEAEERCARVGATPEGQLLVGMFWLRRAQYVAAAYGTLTETGRRRWQEAIGRADRAFSDGQRSLTDNTLKLNWPGEASWREVTLRQMLDYGDELRQFYSSSCQEGAIPTGNPDAVRIFEYYQIVHRGPTPCIPERPLN